MSVTIKSGASTDLLSVDATSKAGRFTQYDTTGRSLAAQSKYTYFAANTFTPAATATDIVTIYGAANTKIRVVSLKLFTTNTAAGSQQFFLIKRSAANTAGTFVAGTPVPSDSDDIGASATVGHYTANPSSLGAAVGTLLIARVASPAAVPASFAGVREHAGYEFMEHMQNSTLDKPVTLNSATEGLVINFNGAALVAGQTHTYQIIWTEEAT